MREDGCGSLLNGGSVGQFNLFIIVPLSKKGFIMESDIVSKGKESVNITVSTEESIYCNVVGKNPHSSDFF